MKPHCASRILRHARRRLQHALRTGSGDLGPGLAAWESAVRAHNHWAAAVAHAQQAEKNACQVLEHLALWAAEHPIPARERAPRPLRGDRPAGR